MNQQNFDDSQAPMYAPAAESGTQPGHGAPAGAPYPAKTNTLAIVSLVSAFFIGLVGVICGHISLRQIKRTGEGGKGLAAAGLIVGYLNIAVWTLLLILTLVGVGVAVNQSGAVPESSETEEIAPTEPTEPSESTDSFASESAPSDSGREEAPGGYSREFCDALLAAAGGLSEAGGSADRVTELGELLGELGQYESPNQQMYKDLAANPGSYDTEQFEKFSQDAEACLQ